MSKLGDLLGEAVTIYDQYQTTTTNYNTSGSGSSSGSVSGTSGTTSNLTIEKQLLQLKDVLLSPTTTQEQKESALLLWRRLFQQLTPEQQKAFIANNYHPDIPAGSTTSNPDFKVIYDSWSWWEKVKYDVSNFTTKGILIIIGCVSLFGLLVWGIVKLVKSKSKKSYGYKK